jgi:hypothetical protein
MTCRSDVEARYASATPVDSPCGKRPLARERRRCDDNIAVDLGKITCEEATFVERLFYFKLFLFVVILEY